MTDLDLMQSIKAKWGGVIDAAAGNSTVPPAFFAALIAGESGGNADAKRFEKSVLASLWEVLLGRETAFGSIKNSDLVTFIAGVSDPRPVFVPQSLPVDAFQRLDALATSWGLLQIMGYNAIPFQFTLDELKTPQGNLDCSLHLLAGFAHTWRLDVTRDFEQLFHCWNTGRPDGKTFDPLYATNGLTRMAIWTSL